MPATDRPTLILAFSALALLLGTGLPLPVMAAETAAQAPAGGGLGKRLFKQLDTNGDGTLDQVELESFKAGQATKADADGDGKITAAELKATRKKMSDAGAQKLLTRLDTDKDGVVTVTELNAAGDRMIARLDTNKDGKIEAGELPARQPRRASAASPN